MRTVSSDAAGPRGIPPTVSYDPDGADPALLIPRRQLSAEQRLLASVLEFALDDLFRERVGARDARPTDAAAFFFAEPVKSYRGFSLEFVCQHLGLDAEAIRTAVLARMNAS